MTSHKVVNQSLILEDFSTSERVDKSKSTFFYVQDPEDGLWGIFENSKGLIIPCTHTMKPKKVKYGFWLLETKGSAIYLWNPDTKKGTVPSLNFPHQIDAHHAIISNSSHSILFDLLKMRVYGVAEKSHLENTYLGFEGVSVQIPSAGRKFSALITRELLFLMTYNDRGHILQPFLMDLETGNILTLLEIER